MKKQPVHMAACRYSGELLTPRSQMEDDCCCPPPDAPVVRCVRVTGNSRQPMDWEARRGPQREDGRYEVLCGYPAQYTVSSYEYSDPELTCCARCLADVVDELHVTALVVPIQREPDVPPPPPGEIVRRLRERRS